MQRELRQGTAVDVLLGIFVDDTDFKSPETGLTIAQANVLLSKNAGAASQKNDATTCTHRGGGHYSCPLDATDTGTLGALRAISNMSGALGVWEDFVVIDELSFDLRYNNLGQELHGVLWYGTFSSITDTTIVLPGGHGITPQPRVLVILTGGTNAKGKSRYGSLASDTVTVDPAWNDGGETTPSGTLTGFVIAAPKSPQASVPGVDVLFWRGTQPNVLVSNRVDASVGAMANNVLTAAAINTAALTAAKFAAGAIDATAIATGAITAAKLAAGAIAAAGIADGALTNAKLADGAITAAKIAADSIGNTQLADGAISVGKVADGVLTAAKLATDAIGAAQLSTAAAQKIRDVVLPVQNEAFANIQFLLVSSVDHVTPVTGATGLAVEVCIDGASFASGTGTGPTEIGSGLYQYDASAADMNGGVVTFKFTASGGSPAAPDPRFVTLITGAGV